MAGFAGKVALVTGAGAGLGRGYAMALAAAGARVVVNDLPAANGSVSAADAVVAAIQEAGGSAVAAAGSVAVEEDAAAMVRTAMHRYGRIDIVINNAGSLRDRTFLKMPVAHIREILDVHLLGSMLVTHAAWPHMVEHGYGRVILTTSTSGLFGNFGQCNYAAAKMGLIGFMKSLQLEGERYGIRVNTVAPLAVTGLGAEAFDPAFHHVLRVEDVVPLVVHLAAEECEERAGIFQAGAGGFARVEVVLGEGVRFGSGRAITPEMVADAMPRIRSLDSAQPVGSALKAGGDFLLAAIHHQPDEGQPA